MFSLRSITITLVASCALTSGCVAEQASDETSGEDVAEVGQESIDFANGIFATYFQTSDVRGEVKARGGQSLRDPLTGQARASSLHWSLYGQVVFQHMVACALPEGVSLSYGLLKYRGHVGLAPQWETSGLTSAPAQRWVTACVLQSLNALGLEVGIALSGSHPALNPGYSLPDYNVSDIIAFGNLFASTPSMYVCHADDLANACGLNLSVSETLRMCGNSTSCGMTFLGSCSDVCTFDAQGSPQCATPAGDVYAESIKSSLRDTDFNLLYPNCLLGIGL